MKKEYVNILDERTCPFCKHKVKSWTALGYLIRHCQNYLLCGIGSMHRLNNGMFFKK